MQIHDAIQLHTDSEFSFDGVEPTQVRTTPFIPIPNRLFTPINWIMVPLSTSTLKSQVVIVAMVLSFTIQATNHVYNVYDGTGRIDARQWIDHTDEHDSLKSGIEDNSWVRIIGNVKSFNNKRSIIALSVVPIAKNPHSPTKDMNEVYYHQLEALYTHLYTKYGPDPTGSSSGGVIVKSEDGARGIPSAYAAGGNTSSSDDQFYTNFSPAARLIHLWMKANTASAPVEGLSFVAIAKGVKGELEALGSNDVAQQVSDAIDWLTDDGYIYALLDEVSCLPYLT